MTWQPGELAYNQKLVGLNEIKNELILFLRSLFIQKLKDDGL